MRCGEPLTRLGFWLLLGRHGFGLFKSEVNPARKCNSENWEEDPQTCPLLRPLEKMLRPMLRPFAKKTSVKQCLLRRYDLHGIGIRLQCSIFRSFLVPPPVPSCKISFHPWLLSSPVSTFLLRGRSLSRPWHGLSRLMSRIKSQKSLGKSDIVTVSRVKPPGRGQGAVAPSGLDWHFPKRRHQWESSPNQGRSR